MHLWMINLVGEDGEANQRHAMVRRLLNAVEP